MTDKPESPTEAGSTYEVGNKKPPKERRFGQPNGNPRNDRGVPEEALWLRHEAQRILAELLDMPSTNGKKNKRIRRLVALLRRMSSANQPAAWIALLKIAYPGAFTEDINLHHDGRVPVTLIEIVKSKDE